MQQIKRYEGVKLIRIGFVFHLRFELQKLRRRAFNDCLQMMTSTGRGCGDTESLMHCWSAVTVHWSNDDDAMKIRKQLNASLHNIYLLCSFSGRMDGWPSNLRNATKKMTRAPPSSALVAVMLIQLNVITILFLKYTLLINRIKGRQACAISLTHLLDGLPRLNGEHSW